MKKQKSNEGKQKRVGVNSTFTTKFYMLIASGIIFILGVALFVIYFFTLNMPLGALGAVMVAGGIFTFRYFWNKEEDISIEHIDGVTESTECNSLNIYPDRIEFAEVYKPEGFPYLCINLKKKFYVNIWDESTKKLKPFTLPDQQYYDPGVFAQRVLGLPAHKKIFERKPKLLQQLKPAILVLAIGIVWLLIVTTGSGG